MQNLKSLAPAALLALALAACAGEPAPAPEPEPAPLSQDELDAQQEAANLAIVDEWWRSVIQARHVELAEQFMAPDYIQHNPNINTGRDAFVAIFGAREPIDIPATLTPAPVVTFAKGDYVMFMWERQGMDEAGEAYAFNFFDLVRVENGLVAEHWDSVYKDSEMLVETGIGPRPVAPPNTPDEQAAEDIANIEFKDILQYGHLELADQVMAEGYLQHNPNVPTGRQGFVDFFAQFAQAEPIQDAWKDEPELILTSGDLVFYMMKRYSADPADPSRVYKWNWFDMVRVGDGLVQEHWDMATKTNPPASVPVPDGFVEYR
jgi:predicted SnoaL-like aldol condensation-catalyzing enzyme